MKLSLAPIPYAWTKETIFSFYEAICETPIDIVYLGETVCLKRHEMRLDDWLSIAQKLKAAQKEVVLSTQVLIESESHLKVMQQITKQEGYFIEAGEMGAVRLLSAKGPFVCGMHLNHYSLQSINFLASIGAKRFVMPFELSRNEIKSLMGDYEIEVLGFGRLPLAYSARCFTARHENLPKDDCQFRCMNYPEGLTLKTQDDQSLFILNGIQIQSFATHSLLKELFELKEMGIDIVRIIPQQKDTATIIHLFSEVLKEKISMNTALEQMKAITPKLCNGYWYQKEGMAYVS